MIELKNVSRWYGLVIGLNDVSCVIPAGITALLGQNGAGKSTMMRLVTGQIKPTAGQILIDGEEPFANPNVFRKLGYCPEIDKFYEDQTGRWFVNHMARLQGFNAVEAKRRTEETLILVGMIDRCDKKIAGYSKGMRQRIKLAQAMLHNPQTILLDEPLNGLDPVGRHEFISVLGQLAEQGKAIVVSSHILHEVEQLTKNILLLHRGRLLATGDLRTIRSLIDKHPHRIQIESPEPRAIAGMLAVNPDVISLQIDRDFLNVEVKNAEGFYTSFAKLVVERNLRVTAFTSPDNNLESVFRYLVGG
jgi:ABC-2 type transport system ATP-binding protein